MLRRLILFFTLLQLAFAPVAHAMQEERSSVEGLSETALLGIGSGNLSVAMIGESVLDSALRPGLSSAAYGTDFADSFVASLATDVVSMLQRDIQNTISASFDAGTIENILSHVVVGCAASELTGADCHAGVVGALAERVIVKSGVQAFFMRQLDLGLMA